MQCWKVVGLFGLNFSRKLSDDAELSLRGSVEGRPAGGVRISVFEYEESRFQEREAESVDECFPLKALPTITWINVIGAHQPEVVGKIEEKLNLHPLVVEDIMSRERRPRIEYFEDYVFITLRMLRVEGAEISSENVSLIVGPNYVVSLQEREGDVFDPVRVLIRSSKGKIRRTGSDYLAYSLMDAIVDGYFSVGEGWRDDR